MLAVLNTGRRDALAAALRAWEKPASAGSEALPSALNVPRSPAELAAHYDLTISHPAVTMPSYSAFENWLAHAAAALGMTCALLHDGVVEEAARRLDQGRLTIGFHLDYFALWHIPDDPYARLAHAIQDSGGKPINSPARSRFFTDKANAHVELQRHGFGVPETIVIRPWAADRPLSESERKRLQLGKPGRHVYVKPANGFSGNGIVRIEYADADSFVNALRAGRNYDRRDTYIIQREVRPPSLRGDDGIERPAYWRVLYCLGELIPFWWSKHDPVQGKPSYRRLTSAEIQRHRLRPVLAFAEKLAELSGLDWFSTELCLSNEVEPSRYCVRDQNGREQPVVAIDYFNDQCDVDVQSRWPGAPPDAVVRHLAERFAEAAYEKCRVIPFCRQTDFTWYLPAA
jgi:hypothetical protein